MARGDRRRVPSRDQGDSTRDRIADDRPEIERLRRTRAFQRCAGSSLSTRCPIDEKLSPDLIAADALSLFFALAPRARVAPGENYRRRDPSGITRVWLQVRRFCRRPGSLVSTMQRDRRPAIAILSTWETSPRIPGPADGVFLNSRPMRRSVSAVCSLRGTQTFSQAISSDGNGCIHFRASCTSLGGVSPRRDTDHSPPRGTGLSVEPFTLSLAEPPRRGAAARNCFIWLRALIRRNGSQGRR